MSHDFIFFAIFFFHEYFGEYSKWAMIFLLAIVVIVYFIPTWIADSRKHQNVNAIFATNLLLGWTILGWVAAFIWSLTKGSSKSSEDTESQSGSKVS